MEPEKKASNETAKGLCQQADAEQDLDKPLELASKLRNVDCAGRSYRLTCLSSHAASAPRFMLLARSASVVGVCGVPGTGGR